MPDLARDLALMVRVKAFVPGAVADCLITLGRMAGDAAFSRDLPDKYFYRSSHGRFNCRWDKS